MFDMRAMRRGFSRAAPAYDVRAGLQREVREHCLALAREHWREDAHILDVGCGTGALAEEAAHLRWRITGCDAALGMCHAAYGKSCAVVNADAGALPFADESFDGVFSSLMLQWAPDPLKALREIARVTKRGGRSILSTFTHGTLEELRNAFTAIDSGPHVSEFIAPATLAMLAVHAGFLLLEVEESSIVEYYPDVIALMRSLKVIGAGNRHEKRRRGMTPPAQFTQLQEVYSKQYVTEHGLPATWEIFYMVLERK